MHEKWLRRVVIKKKCFDNRVLNLNSNVTKKKYPYQGSFFAKWIKNDPHFSVTKMKQKMKFDYYLLILFDLKLVLQWQSWEEILDFMSKTKELFFVFDYNQYVVSLFVTVPDLFICDGSGFVYYFYSGNKNMAVSCCYLFHCEII